MRITMVCPGFPPEARGGGAEHVSLLSKWLCKAGHEVRVIEGRLVSPQNHPTERFLADDIQVIPVPLVTRWMPSHPSLARSGPPDWRGLKALRRVLTDKPDIIHLHGFGHLIVDFASLMSRSVQTVFTIQAFPRFFSDGPGHT